MKCKRVFSQKMVLSVEGGDVVVVVVVITIIDVKLSIMIVHGSSHIDVKKSNLPVILTIIKF